MIATNQSEHTKNALHIEYDRKMTTVRQILVIISRHSTITEIETRCTLNQNHNQNIN